MGTYEGIKTITMTAGAAFAAGSLHELLAIDDSGRVVKCDGNAADSNHREPVAILAQDMASAGQAVTVVDLDAGGIALVKAGGAIAAGATLVASNTPGKADDVADVAALAANQMPFGKALEPAAAEDEIVRFKVGRYSAPNA